MDTRYTPGLPEQQAKIIRENQIRAAQELARVREENARIMEAFQSRLALKK